MTLPPPRRVLVVDDSAFARKVMRELLGASRQIEIVGVAHDGVEALEKIAELSPDVVTLDLIMPKLDGLGVLRALAGRPDAPRIVIVSTSVEDSELAVEALALGAADVVRKPSALATDRLYEMGAELVRKVLALGGQRDAPAPGAPKIAAPPGLTKAGHFELIVVGTSTGGPQALARVLSDLPGDLPAPVVLALHIPRDYTSALARRLDARSPLTVVEASDGLELVPGLVALAPGGGNVMVARPRGRLQIELVSAGRSLYVPSVDVLFQSAAEVTRRRTLGVVLTGMGDDGLIGARAIVAAGGNVLAEAESSCVVYGMPRCVSEAGLAIEQVPLVGMADAITRRVVA